MIRTCLFALSMLLLLPPRADGPPPKAMETFEAAWKIIRDTHFDTNFNGLDWNGVRAELSPKVAKTRSDSEVREVIQEMLDRLGHSHLMIIPGTSSVAQNVAQEKNSDPAEPAAARAKARSGKRGENGSIGIEVRVIDGKIVIFRVEAGSAAAKAGLQPGWIIHEIDDEPAIDASVKELSISDRERTFMLWHNAAHLLKGGVGQDCALVVDKGDGKKENVVVRRDAESGVPAKLGNLPTLYTRTGTNEFRTASGQRVGYLHFNLWMIPAVAVIDRFVDQYRNADGIIVDLRGNLGGIGGMVMGAAGHFVNDRASLGQMKMRDNELNFVAFPRRVDMRQQATNTFQGKLAILTDAVTLSSAELFAAGMQEMGRGRVFGEATGGQALPAVSDRLPNGDLLYHAVADFTTPKGRRLEGNGVTPDQFVPLRIEALRAQKDETLEAALRWIDSAPQPAADGVK